MLSLVTIRGRETYDAITYWITGGIREGHVLTLAWTPAWRRIADLATHTPD